MRAYVRYISKDVPAGLRPVDVMTRMHYIGAKARMVVTLPDWREHTVFEIEDWAARAVNLRAGHAAEHTGELQN